MLSDSQQEFLNKIMQEAQQRKLKYFERERLGLGHTKYIVLSPNCLEVNKIGSIWAGETYDKEEAREVFHRHWGHENGKPMVYYSGNNYVYPENYADSILDWLKEEDSCYHWSATFQRGRFST